MTKELTEKELLAEISDKISVMTGAIAIQGRDVDTQIRILTRLGLTSVEMGQLLGLHADYIRRRRTTKKSRASK